MGFRTRSIKRKWYYVSEWFANSAMYTHIASEGFGNEKGSMPMKTERLSQKSKQSSSKRILFSSSSKTAFIKFDDWKNVIDSFFLFFKIRTVAYSSKMTDTSKTFHSWLDWPVDTLNTATHDFLFHNRFPSSVQLSSNLSSAECYRIERISANPIQACQYFLPRHSLYCEGNFRNGGTRITPKAIHLEPFYTVDHD